MKTPLIDFAPKAVMTIIKCQQILAKYIEPTLQISPEECISELLGVLDDKNLVKEIKDLTKDMNFTV